MVKKNRWSDFTTQNIGDGKNWTLGKKSGINKRGFLGAFKRKKGLARTTSDENLQDMGKIVGEEMEKLGVSQRPSYKAEQKMMARAEELRQEGKFSSIDKENLRKAI